MCANVFVAVAVKKRHHRHVGHGAAETLKEMRDANDREPDLSRSSAAERHNWVAGVNTFDFNVRHIVRLALGPLIPLPLTSCTRTNSAVGELVRFVAGAAVDVSCFERFARTLDNA